MVALVEVKTPSAPFARVAARHHRTPQEIAALYLDDLRFPNVFFRVSRGGREAMVRGTGLTVWELVRIVRAFSGNVSAAAVHLEIDEAMVREAQAYAAQWPREVEQAISESQSLTLDRLQAGLPGLHVFDASGDNERS